MLPIYFYLTLSLTPSPLPLPLPPPLSSPPPLPLLFSLIFCSCPPGLLSILQICQALPHTGTFALAIPSALKCTFFISLSG